MNGGKLFYHYGAISSELRVWGRRSPLSDWAERTMASILQFEIVLNKPKKQVIRGNQLQLEELITSVNGYVDRLLNYDTNLELRLFHRIGIPDFPEFSQTELSTLELFDLQTNLELLSEEIEILPKFELELSPVPNFKWFYMTAAAIAVVIGSRFLVPQPSTYPSQSVVSSRDNSLEAPSKLNKPLSKPPALPPKSSPKPIELEPTSKNNRLPSITPSPNLSQTFSPNPSPNSSQRRSPSAAPKNNPITLPFPNVNTNSDANEDTSKSISKPQNQILPTAPLTISPPNSSEFSSNSGLIAPQGSVSDNSFSEVPKASSTVETKEKINEVPKLSARVPSMGNANLGSGDRLRNSISKVKVQIIKIDGTSSTRDIQAYREKIESFSFASKSVTDIQEQSINVKYTVQWQNRQITKISPLSEELQELTEFIRRSLFETFTDRDGSLEITLKMIPIN